MIDTTLSLETMPQTAHTTAVRGEHPSHRQVLDSLAKELTFAEAVVISTLPRGGLQIVQPHKVSEPFLKAYSRDFQGKDDVTWRAITDGVPVRADAKSPYVQEFLKTFGYEYAAAAPVQAPVFDGYTGVIQVVRTAEQGPFSDADLKKLMDAARRLDSLVSSTRASRLGAADHEPVWTSRPSIRQVVLDGRGKVRLFEAGFDELDDRIRQQMIEQARTRVSQVNGELVTSNRVLLPDSAGDHWTYNAVVFTKYPALVEDGPVVFFCLQPSCPEWSTIRPSDFQADAEVSRLVPALKFMQQEFHRSPTLVEISKTVH